MSDEEEFREVNFFLRTTGDFGDSGICGSGDMNTSYAEVCRNAIFIPYLQENNFVVRGIRAIKSAGVPCACPCKCQLQVVDDLH